MSGPFWTVNVQYTNTTNPQANFSGPLVFQLFNSAGSTTLTPNTVSMIQQFTNDGYYTSTGKYITRVATGFPGATNYVVQGGAATVNGTGSSGQPKTPFANENVQQLAFTGSDQLAMANSGGTNSNDTQFFITTGLAEQRARLQLHDLRPDGPQPDVEHGPVRPDDPGKLTQIPVMFNSALNENSQPVQPGLHVGVAVEHESQRHAAARHHAGDVRPDGHDHGHRDGFRRRASRPSQTFTVTVGAYAGPTDPSINFRPFANATTVSATQGQRTTGHAHRDERLPGFDASPRR